MTAALSCPPTDWNVWNFLGDLPLQAMGPEGSVYLETEWLEIQ